MSFADGLLHERQEKDAKTRAAVRQLIDNLRKKIGTQAPGDIGALEGKHYSLSSVERELVLHYLTAYLDGGTK